MAASRRIGRPRGATLTQAQVVTAARQLASGGLGTLTMARVAAVLGVTPMAVYRHVKNKDELLTLVLDAVYAEVVVPPADLPWELRLRTLHTRVVAALTTYPGTADQFLDQRASSPNTVRLLDAYLSILVDAGLDERDAVGAYTTLYYLAGGQAVDHAGSRLSTPAGHAHPDTDGYPLVRTLQP